MHKLGMRGFWCRTGDVGCTGCFSWYDWLHVQRFENFIARHSSKFNDGRLERNYFQSFDLEGHLRSWNGETWYKMEQMLISGLDLTPVITHHYGIHDFQKVLMWWKADNVERSFWTGNDSVHHAMKILMLLKSSTDGNTRFWKNHYIWQLLSNSIFKLKTMTTGELIRETREQKDYYCEIFQNKLVLIRQY